ncbi:MAG TPA: hypothetical protein VHA30_02575 [Patescibacteria group bacterium]|nr:hypothetical protein [Patescibacteria group bacterium]
MSSNKIFFKICLALSLLAVAGSPFAALAQSVNPGFNPDNLISDKAFSDTQTFGGADGIQKFLESKGSVLADTDPSFLVKLKEPSIAMLKQALDDPEPNLPRLRTAAELIWDASQQSGLNPQVILVTLNKEQGLITGFSNPADPALPKALDHAMGLNCGDDVGCWSIYPGFYYQLFGNYDSEGNRYLGAARSLMKSFSTPGGRGPAVGGAAAKVGDTITLDNTLGGYDGITAQQTITLLDNATAALYRYTPHVFNGNYNFWKYFTAWFKYQNGALLKLASSGDLYIIQNGLKQPVPAFVATARALNPAAAITVSSDELSDYQTDKVYGPADNTVVRVTGDSNKYVFLDNVKHLASDFVITQRGLDPDNYLTVTPAEAALFDQGSVLPPKDGTVIRGAAAPAVYEVAAGTIKLFSAYTFAQNKISPKQIVTVPDAELASYTQSGFVPPLDGSLVKAAADSTVYLVQSGLKQPVLADVFKNRGLSIKSVSTISADEINALPLGNYAPPKDYTFFAVNSKTGPLYEYKEGTKHVISAYVAKQRGITPDYIFSQAVADQWSDGIAIPPKDGTVVKGDQDSTVYLVQGAQLRPLTAQAFKNRKLTAKKIVVLPQTEVSGYATGDIIEK